MLNSGLSTFRALFDYKKYAVLSFVTAIMLIVARMLGAAIGGGFHSTIGRLIAEVISALLCLLLLNKYYFKNVTDDVVDKKFGKEQDVYSLQIMLTDGLWAIFMLNDIFLLGQFSGNELIIADYKVAYVIPANLSILTSAMGTFVAPYFTKYENEKAYDWVRKKLLLVVKMTSLIMGVATLGCFVLARPLIVLLYGEEYLSAVPIMRILLIASFFNNGVRAAIANILSAMGVQKLNLYVAGGGILLQVLLNLLLVPKYEAYGVAYTSVVVYIMMSVALISVAWNKYFKNK